MKAAVITLMIVQVVLIVVGIIQLTHGQIVPGLFNIGANAIFFAINTITLKRILK